MRTCETIYEESRTTQTISTLFSHMNETFFFFQAEDGIRDLTVTGVQTCALPISVVYRGRQTKCRPLVTRCQRGVTAGGRMRRNRPCIYRSLRSSGDRKSVV